MTTTLSFQNLREKISMLDHQEEGDQLFGARTILVKQLKILEKTILASVTGHLAIGLVLLSLTFGGADMLPPILWYFGLVLAQAPRVVLYLVRRSILCERRPELWLGTSLSSVVLSGLVWGSALFLTPDSNAPAVHPYLILTFLAGLGCVSVITGAAHRAMIWAFLGGISVSTGLFLLTTAYIPAGPFGLVLIVYVLIMGYCGQLVNRLVLDGLLLEYRNQKLNREISILLNDHYQSMESLHFLVNRMGAGVVMFDQNKRLVTWNQAYERIFDYPKNFLQPGLSMREMAQWYFNRVGNDVEAEAEIEDMFCRLEQGSQQEFLQTEFVFPDGQVYDLRIDFLPDGESIYSFSDATHRAKANTDALVRMTLVDHLTNMPNRLMFRRELKKRLRHSQEKQQDIAVLLLNIDGFKTINEMYGHAAGDRAIVKVGQELTALVGPDDFVARLSGDEFALITNRFETREDVLGLARRIQDAFHKPLTIEEKEITFDLSIGIALYPENQGSPDQLIRNAGIALHKAKEEGGNAAILFNWRMQEEIRDRNSLVTDLRSSMETSQFMLHYQPQIDLKTRQICGVEALMRWNHPERGWISPGEFIPLAEWSKQIIPLTEQLLPETCVQAQVWAAQRSAPVPVSVNISPMHFHDQGLVGFVRDCLREASLEPGILELEITEGIVMSKTEDVMSTLQGLSDLGVRLAIDDFGTGYSSLTYLRRLPVDKLKIDQSFIRDMIQEKEAQSVVEAIIRLGHSFNLEVIAEGIETSDQLDLLAAMNCDQAQGFLISRPLSASGVTDWIRTHSP